MSSHLSNFLSFDFTIYPSFILFYVWDVLIDHVITVKSTYKGQSREPENVVFISNCPLYTDLIYMHYSLMGKMRLLFICSDLLDRGAL